MHHQGIVPAANDAAVVQFQAKWRLTNKLVRLPYIDHGYGAAWCHVSAKHRALSDGGRRVHGWALWKFGPDLFADHHSVWENENGDLVDVTPPSNGGGEILFVRDDDAKIRQDDGTIYLFTQRTAHPDVHWYWQGKPSEYSHWPCPPDKADLVEYAANLDFPVSKIVTDDDHG